MRAGGIALLAFGSCTLAIAAACGGGGGGGGSNGGSPTPPPNGNLVHVVGSDGSPLASIPVVVNDSAGEIVAQATTGADGSASVEIPLTGSVTILDVTPDGHEAQTIVMPPHGITLTFRVATTPAPTPAPTSTSTIQATFNAAASIQTIDWFANCYGFPAVPYSSGVMSQQSVAPCGGAWNFVAIGYDGGGNAAAWTQVLGVPDVPDGDVPVTLDLTANSAFDTVSVGHAALPGSATSNASLTWTVDTAGAMTLVAIDYNNPLPQSAAPQATAADVPHGAGVAWFPRVDAVITSANGTSLAFHEDWKTTTAPAGSYTLDPAGRATVGIPHINVTDPARLVFTWSVNPGTTGVAGFAEAKWITGTDAASRFVVFPATLPATFTLPKLPAGSDAWLPTAASTYSSWRVGYDDLDAATDFGAWLTADEGALATYDHFATWTSVP